MTAWEKSRTMMHLREVGVMREVETMKTCDSGEIRIAIFEQIDYKFESRTSILNALIEVLSSVRARLTKFTSSTWI